MIADSDWAQRCVPGSIFKSASRNGGYSSGQTSIGVAETTAESRNVATPVRIAPMATAKSTSRRAVSAPFRGIDRLPKVAGIFAEVLVTRSVSILDQIEHRADLKILSSRQFA